MGYTSILSIARPHNDVQQRECLARSGASYHLTMGSPWAAADSSAAMSEPPAISCTESATAANHRRRAYSRDVKSKHLSECTKADSTSYYLTTCHRQPQELLSDSSHHSFKPLRIIVNLWLQCASLIAFPLRLCVNFWTISPQLDSRQSGV